MVLVVILVVGRGGGGHGRGGGGHGSDGHDKRMN